MPNLQQHRSTLKRPHLVLERPTPSIADRQLTDPSLTALIVKWRRARAELALGKLLDRVA